MSEIYSRQSPKKPNGQEPYQPYQPRKALKTWNKGNGKGESESRKVGKIRGKCQRPRCDKRQMAMGLLGGQAAKI